MTTVTRNRSCRLNIVRSEINFNYCDGGMVCEFSLKGSVVAVYRKVSPNEFRRVSARHGMVLPELYKIKNEVRVVNGILEEYNQ